MNIQEEVTAVEKELLELIVQHLENSKLSSDQAQKLAKDFLAVLPVSDQQDLLGKLKTLGETYEEAKEVYVEEYAKISDQQRNQVLNQMRSAIQQGNIEQAISVAKSIQQ